MIISTANVLLRILFESGMGERDPRKLHRIRNSCWLDLPSDYDHFIRGEKKEQKIELLLKRLLME